MIKTERFTFWCDNDDRRAISTIAERLQRTQSDAVRWLINQAAREMNSDKQTQCNEAMRDALRKAAPTQLEAQT